MNFINFRFRELMLNYICWGDIAGKFKGSMI